MALVSITLNTGATLNGRALASSGSVSLDSTSVTAPSTTPPPPPVISQSGIVNAGSGTLASLNVAPGSIASVFGTNLSIGTESSNGTIPLPPTLASSSFQIGGLSAPLFYASPLQVNLQIPWALAGQPSASVTATVGGAASNQQSVGIVPFAPGIFTVNMQGTGQGAVLIAGTSQVAAAGSPVHPGQYIEIYCTGLGAVSNQPATGAAAKANPLSPTITTPIVTIGGIVASPSSGNFSGLAPGFVGLNQVDVQVPPGTAPGNAVPLTINIGGFISNTVLIAVQ